VHVHRASEEYYLLLHGELRLLLADAALSLRAQELLMVRPGVPHAILGGEGQIEHFGLRAPAPDDRRVVADVADAPGMPVNEDQRELRRAWGYRIALHEPHNRNCWLTGLGAARYRSPHLLLAYLDFPTAEEANAGLGTRHRPHLHKASWEYYAVLSGSKTLLVEDEPVTIAAGQLLEVAPGVKHTLHQRHAPYRGFTFRVPIVDDKVTF
jgi:mannose-6-phosphate isomerase-like protein (cupin superfamily)